jgi:DNA-binding beta-propeller fold protein YncE
MKHVLARLLIFATVAVISILPTSAPADAAPAPIYKLTFSLKTGGEGGWDYVTLNPAGTLLYVTRATHTMIVNVHDGRLVRDLPDLGKAHGVALVPEVGRGFINDGKLGSVTVFDLTTGAAPGKIAAAPDADAIIYDPASQRILVFCGDAHRMIAIAPNADLKVKGGGVTASIDLGGSPEYAVADGHGRVFVNITDKDEVAVVDSRLMKVIARWSVGPGKRPTGLSMDRATRRLFVGCRNRKLVIIDADDGKVVADFPIGAGVDATAFYNGLIFASCFDGTLTIIQELAPGHFERAQTVRTEPGARTMAIDRLSGTVYLPTADLEPAPPATASNPHPRAQPIPGTFRILVVTSSAAAGTPK